MIKLFTKITLLFFSFCAPLCGIAQNSSSPKCPQNLPAISFKKQDSKLSATAKVILTSIASQLKEYPDCILLVTIGQGDTKAEVNLCFRRAELIKRYLGEHEGIVSERINLNCVPEGDANTADFQAQGPEE